MSGRAGGIGRYEVVWRGFVIVAWLGMAANHLRNGDHGHAVVSAVLGLAYVTLELRTRARRRRDVKVQQGEPIA